MRIAVTGWTGNIGTLLLQRLEQSGVDLIKVGRNAGSDYRADLGSTSNAFEFAPYCDVLVHLAWYTEHPLFWTSPLNEVFLNSSVQLINIFQATNPQIRVIGAGSCAELYSDSHNRHDLGFAKRHLRQLLQEQYGIPTTWFQIFFAYGRGEPSTKLLSIIKYSDNPHEVIKEPGAIRDFIHFSEIALTLEASIMDTREGCFQLGNGYGYLISDLIQYKLSGEIPKRYSFSDGSSHNDFKVADPAFRWPQKKPSDHILAWLNDLPNREHRNT